MLRRTCRVISGVAQPKNLPGVPTAWMATDVPSVGVVELVAHHHREGSLDPHFDESVGLVPGDHVAVVEAAAQEPSGAYDCHALLQATGLVRAARRDAAGPAQVVHRVEHDRGHLGPGPVDQHLRSYVDGHARPLHVGPGAYGVSGKNGCGVRSRHTGQAGPAPWPRSGQCARGRSRGSPRRNRSAGTAHRCRRRHGSRDRAPTPTSSPPRRGIQPSRACARACRARRSRRPRGRPAPGRTRIARGRRTPRSRGPEGALTIGGGQGVEDTVRGGGDVDGQRGGAGHGDLQDERGSTSTLG